MKITILTRSDLCEKVQEAIMLYGRQQAKAISIAADEEGYSRTMVAVNSYSDAMELMNFVGLRGAVATITNIAE